MLCAENIRQLPELSDVLADPVLAEQTLNQLGLDALTLDNVWGRYGYGQCMILPNNVGDPNAPQGASTPDPERLTQDEYRALCIRRIFEMEDWRPGSTAQAHRRFGWYNYGRFSAPLLQHMTSAATDRRYKRAVLGAFAVGDYNGALLDSGDCLSRALEDLPDDTCMLLCEFCDDEDLIQRLGLVARAWSIYREDDIAAEVFALVGHGSPKGVQGVYTIGGRSSWLGEIDSEDIEGEVGDLTARLASLGATILLDACSCALGENSFAEAAHKKTGLHVIGARADIETAFIRIRQRAGRLEVTPGFYRTEPQGGALLRVRSAARHFRPPVPGN